MNIYTYDANIIQKKLRVFWLEICNDLDFVLLEQIRKMFEAQTPQYIFQKDMMRHTCAILLAVYAWKKEYSEFPFTMILRDLNGKPYFSNCSDKKHMLYFNLTHSGDIAMCVTGASEVGADIEQIQKIPTQVAKRYFDLTEQEKFFKTTLDKQDEVFYQIWTKKESLLKAIGLGLRGLGKNVENDWICTPLFIREGYAASVCCKGEYSVLIESISSNDLMGFCQNICNNERGDGG
ncbi:MAG: 4'-phosphopantetheinyl transferase superfamily protein [Christensenellaceae bacterium]|jgi:phosphopantetheine--protein transferase-like protein|nr:4'-phosphopantetheinyl transferase superfamily protein [Christensenellaceae bacterium]